LENDIDSNTAGAISVWFIKDDANDPDTIFCHTDLATNDYYIWFFVGSNNYLNFIYRNGSGTAGDDYALYYGDTTISTSTWYHGVLSTDGSAWKLYVNNSEESLSDGLGGSNNTGNWFGDLDPNDHDDFIGKFARTGENDHYWDGILDNVIIFSSALTSSEISFLYNSDSGTEDLYEQSSAGGGSLPIYHHWRRR